MKKKALLLMLMISVSFAGCGSKVEDVMAENVENTQTESMEEETVEVPESVNLSPVYTEEGNLYVLDSDYYNIETLVDMDALKPDGNSYTLVKSIDIYNTDANMAGYTKENFEILVITSNEEWSYCSFGEEANYLVRTDELMDSISKEDKERLEVASAISEPVPETPVSTEQPKTETPVAEVPTSTPTPEPPKEESTPTVSEPVVDTPVVEEPPAVVESDKYTPEEAISVYRSIMEANGMIWTPSLKDGGSWGTGWIPLAKGQPEYVASANLESCAMGNGDSTNPVTHYYLEVTGSDENYVYITEWSD